MLGADGDVQSYNLFAYCGNNPVSKVDAIGKFANSVIGLVVGGVVGGLSALIKGEDVTSSVMQGATTGFFSGMAVDTALAVVAAAPIAAVGIAFIGGALANIAGEETESLIRTGDYVKDTGGMIGRSLIAGGINVFALGFSAGMKGLSNLPKPQGFNGFVEKAMDQIFDSSIAAEDAVSSFASVHFSIFSEGFCS